MSQTSHEPRRVSAPTDESIETLRAPLPTPERRPSHTWQDWTYFGAAIMGMLGASWVLLGIISLVDDERPTFRVNQLLAIESASAWGWAHLLGGLLAATAAVRDPVGRTPMGPDRRHRRGGAERHREPRLPGASPVWSTLMIGLDVVIIFALTVHGWEIEE